MPPASCPILTDSYRNDSRFPLLFAVRSNDQFLAACRVRIEQFVISRSHELALDSVGNTRSVRLLSQVSIFGQEALFCGKPIIRYRISKCKTRTLSPFPNYTDQDYPRFPNTYDNLYHSRLLR